MRSRAWLPWFLLLANVLVAVVFFAKLYIGTYTSEIRHATGVLLAGLLCIPYLSSRSSRRRAWLIGAAAVTLGLFPVIAVHGWDWRSA